MDQISLLIILLFLGALCALAFYLYMKTSAMAATGGLKMNKKRTKKDKSPGTVFD